MWTRKSFYSTFCSEFGLKKGFRLENLNCCLPGMRVNKAADVDLLKGKPRLETNFNNRVFPQKAPKNRIFRTEGLIVFLQTLTGTLIYAHVSLFFYIILKSFLWTRKSFYSTFCSEFGLKKGFRLENLNCCLPGMRVNKAADVDLLTPSSFGDWVKKAATFKAHSPHLLPLGKLLEHSSQATYQPLNSEVQATLIYFTSSYESLAAIRLR